MKQIIIYLLVVFVAITGAGLTLAYKLIDLRNQLIEFGVYCFLFGSLGGIVHCLRSVYLHHALMEDWNERWNIWYYLRPLVSGIIGLMSFVFINAGLLVFSTQTELGNSKMVYVAVAFLCGYNVKNFLSKIEDVSKAALGIEKKTFPGNDDLKLP